MKTNKNKAAIKSKTVKERKPHQCSDLWLKGYELQPKTLETLLAMMGDNGAAVVLKTWLGPYYSEATTHSSWVKENSKGHHKNNEILEFVGDSVLALAISEILIERFPQKNEGDLSLMRHQLVNNQQLAHFANQIDLGTCLKLGKGEEQSGGRTRERMLANAFESILGGLYRHRGIGSCIELLQLLCEHHLHRLATYVPAKQRLHEWAQKKYRKPPEYIDVSVQGPQHNQLFVQEVKVNGKAIAQGTGTTKKEASQKAAMTAIKLLKVPLK